MLYIWTSLKIQADALHIIEMKSYFCTADPHFKTFGPLIPAVSGKFKFQTDILTISQMTNFRLFQTERVCRQQF